MDIIDNLIKSRADFKLFKLTKTAKNALDFQLVLFLGTRLRKYGKKAKYYIISADNGYQSSIDFAKEYFRIEVTKAESIKEAIKGTPPKLLLEDNPKENLEVISFNQECPPQVDEVVGKLKQDAVLSSKLVASQMVGVATILLDENCKSEDVAIQLISDLLGKSKTELIPIIFRRCGSYLQFVPTVTQTGNEQIREEIEQKLESNTVIKLYLNQTQIKQISSLLVDSSRNTREIATKNIRQFIGTKREHILPNILECCKDYIR
jgi:RNA-binding protein YhbY